jgi:hypothetical protein
VPIFSAHILFAYLYVYISSRAPLWGRNAHIKAIQSRDEHPNACISVWWWLAISDFSILTVPPAGSAKLVRDIFPAQLLHSINPSRWLASCAPENQNSAFFRPVFRRRQRSNLDDLSGAPRLQVDLGAHSREANCASVLSPAAGEQLKGLLCAPGTKRGGPSWQGDH